MQIENIERVNHPDHYQSENGVEAIDAILAALGTEGTIQFCVGNALKYLFRAGKKDISPRQEDFEKALWYINYAKELVAEPFKKKEDTDLKLFDDD